MGPACVWPSPSRLRGALRVDSVNDRLVLCARLRAPAPHVPLPSHLQLPPVLLRPGGVHERHVDAVRGTELAGPQPQRQRRGPRDNGRPAVRAHPVPRGLGRRARRPRRQAQAAHGDPGGRRGPGACARRARRGGRRHGVDDLGAHRSHRGLHGAGHPVAAELRVRDGGSRRPGQRGRAQLGGHQLVTDHRPGDRCCAHRLGRCGSLLLRERGVVPRCDRGAGNDAHGRAAARQARRAQARAGARRPQVRLDDAVPARAAGHAGRDQHARLQLLGDPAAAHQERVRPRRRLVPASSPRPWASARSPAPC